MPRPIRFVVPGLPHHITQRGNYRQTTFFEDPDYGLYLKLLREYARRADVSVQAYCLMPNHVHLIVVPHSAESLPRLLQRLHADYAHHLHIRLGRTGHLWQARYFSTPMDDPHFWSAMVYVEQNPERAGLVQHAWDWRWSSAREHLAESDTGLLDVVAWRREHDPGSWRRCLELGLRDADLLARIREAGRCGWPLGSEDFLTKLEQEMGRPVRRASPGRRPKI